VEIRLEGVTKVYRGGVTALDNLTLTIPQGMFGLLGPNGAGKTTLMRILVTLLEPTAGRISIAGIDRLREPHRVRQIIGYLPQEFGFYRRVTAREYLDFAAGMKGLPPAVRRRQVDELLDRVNLSREADRPVGGFSGGMKRRLGIAQALLGDPRVLIVDEPTAGLDPEERIRFRNLLAELAGNRIILLSTHIVADVESACPSLAVIDGGRLRFVGSPGELARRAEGRVWQLELPAADYERLRPRLRIVGARRTGDSMELRVLDPENPLGQGRPLPPTLEDGYLALMEGIPA